MASRSSEVSLALPVATLDEEFVVEGGVGADAGGRGGGTDSPERGCEMGISHQRWHPVGEFGDEGPAEGAGGFGEEVLEGGADGTFVGNALGRIGFQRG